MSRKGNCWDNAVAESYFKTQKSEMGYQQEFQTKEIAKQALFEYIEICGSARRYNRQRRHSALKYHSPLNNQGGQFSNVA
jgi:transposase InsO family protein